MAHSPLPELSLVFHFLREGQGVGQAELGRLAGVSPNLLNDYEKGRKPLHRDRLEHLISFLGLPPEAIDATLARLDANRVASRASGAPGDPRTAAHRQWKPWPPGERPGGRLRPRGDVAADARRRGSLGTAARGAPLGPPPAPEPGRQLT